MLPLRNPVPITAFVVPLGDPSRASIHTGLPFWLPNFSHKKTVTYVPGLFCNLCPRNVPVRTSPWRSRLGNFAWPPPLSSRTTCPEQASLQCVHRPLVEADDLLVCHGDCGEGD